MAENELNSMDSFKEKISEAMNGKNKALEIKNAVMDLLRSYGIQIPNIEFKSGGTTPKGGKKHE